MKRLTSHAVVSGKGPFPIDMLRYDRCYPAAEHESHVMHDTFKNPGVTWKVRLAKNDGQWTDGRWASFGCTIIVES